MDRLAAMALFVRVAETGSFSAAAREAGMTQPTVSKQIAALETYLGARLVNRTTRHVSLTEEGAQYYERCGRILRAIAEAECELTGPGGGPKGLLRVDCAVSFGRLMIVPRLSRFFERYGGVRIELLMRDNVVDLVEEGADLAIRIGDLRDSSLIARRLGDSPLVVAARPCYLERHGKPRRPDDLLRHNCIVHTRLATGPGWHFEGPTGPLEVRIDGNFWTDNLEAVREAVLSGLGLAILPYWLVAAEISAGRLVPVLRDFDAGTLPIHAVYPSGRHLAGKVRCFVDFLQEELRQQVSPAAPAKTGVAG